MAITYQGQVRPQGASGWTPLFVDVSATSYTWDTSALTAGTYEVQVRAQDTSDGAVSAWSTTRTIVVQHAAAPVTSVVVTEAETAVNGGAWVPLFARLAESRYAWDTSSLPTGATVQVRIRRRDLSDDAVSAWVTRTVSISHPTPAPVTVLSSLPAMRGLSAGELATLAAQDRIDHWRVEVKDEDGAWRDVAALAGEDYVKAVRITDAADANVIAADFTFLRETRRTDGVVDSLAPLLEGSALNVRTSDGTYAPFVQKGREVRVWMAVTARGATPTSGDWVGLFHGYLDDPEWGRGLSVPARDLGSRLLDTLIADAKRYGSESGTPVADVMRQILADNGCGDVTLCVVGDPDWYVRPYEQAAGPTVMQALQDLAAQFGWEVRYRWTGRTTLQLCLYEPARADVSTITPAFTFAPSRRLGLSSFTTESDGIRNVIRVAWRDAATGQQAGPIEVTDPDSVARFGRRVMQLAYDATSNIDTEAEAQALAAYALADLSQPYLRATVEYRALPGIGRDDIVELAPNGVHNDAPQRGAVVAYTHALERTGDGTASRTSVTLRGRPMGAYYQWLRREAPPSPTLGPIVLRARATIIAADDATYTVKLWGEATRGGFPTGQVPTVRVTALFDGTAILAGPAVGVDAPSGTLWTFARPAGATPGSFAFRVAVPGLADEDREPVPQQGVTVEGFARLVWTSFEAVPAQSTPTSTRYRGVLADPDGAATGDATVTLTRSGPITTVTPVTPLTGPLPLTIEFDAPRQPFQSGESIVEAYGSAPGLQGDWERVTIHPVERDTVTLGLHAEMLPGATSEYFDIRFTAPDPLQAAPPGITISGTATVALLTSYQTNAYTSVAEYRFTRPAHGEPPTRSEVVASLAGTVTGRRTVEVSPREDTSVVKAYPITGAEMAKGAINSTMQWAVNQADGYLWNPKTAGGFGIYEVMLRVPPGAILLGLSITYRSPSNALSEFQLRAGGASLAFFNGSDTAGADATVSAVLAHTVAEDAPVLFSVALEDNKGDALRFVEAGVIYQAPSLTVSV